jgi:hypothetical protein
MFYRCCAARLQSKSFYSGVSKNIITELTRVLGASLREKIMLDGNYEAQRHLVNERIAARRAEAEVERHLREDRPAGLSGFKAFLVNLFQRLDVRGAKKGDQQLQETNLANSKKGRFA